jgi:hypothetical protein
MRAEVTGEGQMPTMRGGGEQILYIFEKSREAEFEKGASEQQMATSSRIEQ